MNRRMKREIGEWAKALLGMLAGSALTLALLVFAAIESGCIVKRTPEREFERMQRAYYEDVYSRIAANGLEE